VVGHPTKQNHVSLFVWLISHQPAVLFSQNKPALPPNLNILGLNPPFPIFPLQFHDFPMLSMTQKVLKKKISKPDQQSPWRPLAFCSLSAHPPREVVIFKDSKD
jgi:hypothetical protein